MEREVFDSMKKKMDRALEALKHELSRIRTGRANPAILEDIKVDYYGTPTPINQMATITVPESRLIQVQPWDVSQAGAIEKAIRASDLGLNPTNDGKVIRISIPPLTEERRKELVKLAKKYAEECRISIRNARREANETLKKLEKDKEISQDELKKAQEEVQKITDNEIKKVEEILEVKEKEIMEV